MVENKNSRPIIIALAVFLGVSALFNVFMGLKLSKENNPSFPVVSTEILDGPSLNTSINSQPTVKTGSRFDIVMMTVNNGNVDLKDVLPTPLTGEGNGKAELLSSPAGYSGKLRPGTQLYFTWTYSATAMGTIEYKGSAAAENIQTAGLVTSIETKSNLITIFPPSIK